MKPGLVIYFTIFVIITSCNPPARTVVSSKKAVINTNELQGNWELTAIENNPTGLDSLYPGKKPSISFDVAARRASGNTGCNNFTGALTLDGGLISFNQPLTTSRRFCEGQGEMVFLESLKRVTAWAMTDTATLTLISGETPLLRLRKTP